MKKYLIICLYLIPLTAFAQFKNTTTIDTSNNYSINILYQNGYVFPTNSFVRGSNLEKELINAFQRFSIKVSKQTVGKNQWEQLFNYPIWGIGLSVYDFYNPDEIGNPIALYGYFDAPFKRWNRLTF